MNRNFLLTLMCAGLLIMATGCEDADGGIGGTFRPDNNSNNTTFVETNTPLGCDNSIDHYFDFQDTKTCIRPTTKEQQYILYRYQWVNQVAKDTPNDIIRIRVGFKDYLTQDQYQTLIVNEPKIVEIKEISLFYPDLDVNGLPSNFGLRTGQVVAREDMLEAAKQDAAEIFLTIILENGLPQYAQEDMQNFGIAYVEVTMKTSEVPQWWDDHKDQIRYIQTLLTDMDYVQTPFYPNYAIGDGDQVIDWNK